jgi:hypothetical protein
MCWTVMLVWHEGLPKRSRRVGCISGRCSRFLSMLFRATIWDCLKIPFYAISGHYLRLFQDAFLCYFGALFEIVWRCISVLFRATIRDCLALLRNCERPFWSPFHGHFGFLLRLFWTPVICYFRLPVKGCLGWPWGPLRTVCDPTLFAVDIEGLFRVAHN